jgi:hypothetical protein
MSFETFINKRLTYSDRISGFTWNPCSDKNYLYQINHSQLGVASPISNSEPVPNTLAGASRSFLAFPSGANWVNEIQNYTKQLSNPSDPESNTVTWTTGQLITGCTHSTNKNLTYNSKQYLIVPLDDTWYSGVSVPSSYQYRISGCTNVF